MVFAGVLLEELLLPPMDGAGAGRSAGAPLGHPRRRRPLVHDSGAVMNQEELGNRVLARLEQAASANRDDWVATADLTEDLIGDEPTRRQLDVLRRVLFRLAGDGRLEVAAFRPDAEGRLGMILRHDGQTRFEIADGTSGGLEKANTRYGVRLIHER